MKSGAMDRNPVTANRDAQGPVQPQCSKIRFLLFVNAFLAIVNFVCVLASYCQLAKILFPPLFFPFLCLII
jgi:hypothetical protein